MGMRCVRCADWVDVWADMTKLPAPVALLVLGVVYKFVLAKNN